MFQGLYDAISKWIQPWLRWTAVHRDQTGFCVRPADRPARGAVIDRDVLVLTAEATDPPAVIAQLVAQLAELATSVGNACVTTAPELTPTADEIAGPIHAGLLADAFPAQLLATDQLAKARDLSAWEVTEVAPERHLVQVRDLAPWFAPTGPPGEVLARARADLEPLLAPSHPGNPSQGAAS